MNAERPDLELPEHPRAVEGDALDSRAVRRAFGRAAGTYAEAAVLQREVGTRMAQRLDVVKLAPAVILDAGCGTGAAQRELATRYPQARRVALDLALPMLAATREHGREHGSPLARLAGLVRGTRPPPPPACVCGDIAALPFASASVRPRLEQSCVAVDQRPAARDQRVPARAEGRRTRVVHDVRARTH